MTGIGAAAAGAKVGRGGVNEEECLDRSKRARLEGMAGMGAAAAPAAVGGENVNEEEGLNELVETL